MFTNFALRMRFYTFIKKITTTTTKNSFLPKNVCCALQNTPYPMYICSNIFCFYSRAQKGTDEIQFIVDGEFDEHDVHVSVDEAAQIADEQDTSNQSQYLLTYSKLNEKLREKLTPIFNRKHYSSLPQPSINYFESRSRKNSCNYSAYNVHILIKIVSGERRMTRLKLVQYVDCFAILSLCYQVDWARQLWVALMCRVVFCFVIRIAQLFLSHEPFDSRFLSLSFHIFFSRSYVSVAFIVRTLDTLTYTFRHTATHPNFTVLQL